MIKRVIVHSNPMAIRFKENWEAKKQYKLFEKEAGCENQGVACLRQGSEFNFELSLHGIPALFHIKYDQFVHYTVYCMQYKLYRVIDNKTGCLKLYNFVV